MILIASDRNNTTTLKKIHLQIAEDKIGLYLRIVLISMKGSTKREQLRNPSCSMINISLKWLFKKIDHRNCSPAAVSHKRHRFTGKPPLHLPDRPVNRLHHPVC